MVKLLDIDDDVDRFTIDPILNHDIWDIYQKMAVPATWFVPEIPIGGDLVDWNDPGKISKDDRYFIEMVLAFFATADHLVANNINMNFLQDVKVMEAEHFYAHQSFMERIHSEVYSKLLNTYVSDPTRLRELTSSLKTIPVIKRKGEWAVRYADANTAQFAERLIAFTIFEGVFFSGSFCAIFYFKKKGLLDGLCLSNDFISRDEALHCKFSCLLYSHVIEKLPEETVHRMFKEAVEIECDFVCEALKVPLIGINANLMSQYIKFVADYWIKQLGYGPIFNVKNPFDWMHLISMEGKTNFFEKRVPEYAIAGVGNDDVDNAYGSDEDF
jgi:ribonucleoside-diphosphate reductase beta chain